MAKGKEIKRAKEEARATCLAYINEFLKDNPNRQVKQEIVEEYNKETFWQRMGMKKVDKEKPLYAIGKEKLIEARHNLKETITAAYTGEKQI